MKKRSVIHFFTFLMILLLSINIVLAADTKSPSNALIDGSSKVINGFFSALSPVFKALFGEPATFSQDVQLSSIFLSKIMFFAIIVAIIFTVLKNMPLIGSTDNKIVLWVVTIAASVLATRWLTEKDLVSSFLLPYDTLGISLVAFLPLAIYFLFVEFVLNGRQYKMVRKAAWTFFIVLFLFLWVTRYGTLTAALSGTVYIISALICLFFLIFDGTIQKWINKAKQEKSVAYGNRDIRLNYDIKLKKIREAYEADPDNYQTVMGNTKKKGIDAYNYDVKKIQDIIANLS